MAHYAFLDAHNVVTEVIVGRNEWEEVDGITDWEAYYGELRNQVCKRTSYNGNIRKNYAAVGYAYNEALDAFIGPKPFASWLLNQETAQWQAPIACPSDDLIYLWNEELGDWEPSNFEIEE